MDQTTSGTERQSGRHFAGSTTLYLVRYVEAHGGQDALEAVLLRAGETRPLEVLTDEASWSSYDQLRRLLAATAEVMGGREHLFAASAEALTSMSMPSATEMLQALGSPAALYANLGQTPEIITTVVDLDVVDSGPTETTISTRFKVGFEPFADFCSFQAGLHSLVPRLFGYPPAEVVEEECQCRGAPSCVFRASWEAIDEPTRRAEYYEFRAQLLESRLAELHRTVADLVSIDDLEGVLSGILGSAARVVAAPAFVLALEGLPAAAETVYARGLGRSDAAEVAAQLLADDPFDDSRLLAVEVVSARRRYGRLAAMRDQGGQFVPGESAVLEAYGRLAAAALDSAASLDEARREAARSRALLELSASWAEIQSIDEMATRLARAVPDVVDCDRAAVVLLEPDTRQARIAGLWGYPAALDATLRSMPVELGELGEGTESTFVRALGGPVGVPSVAERLMAQTGSVAGARVDITANGELIGWLVAAVTVEPERLHDDFDLMERLRGLAGQAGIAFRNARLLEQIRHQAVHDALTGLPNRALILDRTEQMLGRARRERRPVAALFVDLDNFKDINDTLGHEAGDKLLRAVAARLGGALRDSDTVGRLGGDEFVVLAEGVSLAAGPELVAERLQDVLREPFHLDGFEGVPLSITASIGIAEGERANAGDLLREADIALYRAKARGKNCSALFRPQMQSEVLDRLELEMDLRSALARDQFFLLYQPVFDLDRVSVCGVEALLRWSHPARGVVPPDEFVRVLEDTGLILDVGRWVLGQACAQGASWHERGLPLTMSVNVSMRQIETDVFLEHVQEALASSGLDPGALVLEVTETTLMRDTDATVRRLKMLKDLGVRVAIDDFGTGYSSLAYLRRFPVDALKIDRSFVSGMIDSTESVALIHTLVQLGRTLGIETLAEGIEESWQLERLQLEHCDQGQGFLFARPLEPGAVEELVADWDPGDRTASHRHWDVDGDRADEAG
ncbi:MAG TPA: EAL domain-containing protein [Acidimicrobiales bacterium]|nr:EAL domain-containing protein [Acidimicrobiales bacterium]